jgi:hypothetical protein
MYHHVSFGDRVLPLARHRIPYSLKEFEFHVPGPSIFTGFTGMFAALGGLTAGPDPNWVRFLDERVRGLVDNRVNPLNMSLLVVGSMTIDEVVLLLDSFTGNARMGARARIFHAHHGTPSDASCFIRAGVLSLLLNLEVLFLVSQYRSVPLRLLDQFYATIGRMMGSDASDHLRGLYYPGTAVYQLRHSMRLLLAAYTATPALCDQTEHLLFTSLFV